MSETTTGRGRTALPDPATFNEREESRLTDEDRALASAAAAKRRHQRTARELRALVKLLEGELEGEKAKTEFLLNVHDAPEAVHRIEPAPRRRRKPRTVSGANLSDVHAEETVDPATVNWRNTYNLEVAEERLDRYFRNVVALWKKEAKEADVYQHLQWFGGDLMTGHLHKDAVESNALAPYETALWLRPRIKAGLELLRGELDCPIQVVWSFGNHGRDGKKPRVATAAAHNLDWMLGHLVAEDMAGVDGLKFLVAPGYHQYVELENGYVIRYHHGDWTRYQGGVGGLTIPLNKAIDAWNKNIPADLDVLGHWHSTFDLPYLVVNGSLIGWNAYAIKIKARYEPPRQSFFLVDVDRREKTGFFPVHVAGKGES